ncbi:hypothetical protein KF913_00545 [Candidatus Obscuribacterales bacterium]|nr:hypothetical protein [Candidatus Obscuribacterales bacterium]
MLVMFNGGAWINWISQQRNSPPVVSLIVENVFVTRLTVQLAGICMESAFESEEAIERFIQKQGGFRGDAFQTDVVPTSYHPLGLSQAQIESLKPRMRIWFLSPAIICNPASFHYGAASRAWWQVFV